METETTIPQHTVLAYNLLFDHCQRNVEVIPHSMFGYCEPTSWPPEGWAPGQFLCWNCAQSLVNTPVPAPHAKEGDRFIVYGLFCRWSCAKRYLIETQPAACSEKNLLLDDLAYSFGYHGGPILPAPPRECLKSFGGDLSPAAFHNETLEGMTRVTHMPPLLTRPRQYVRDSGIEAQVERLADPRWSRPVKERVLIQAAMQRPEAAAAPQLESVARKPAGGGGLYAQFIDRHGINLTPRSAPPRDPDAEEVKPATVPAASSSGSAKPLLTLGSLRSASKTSDATAE